MVRSTRWALPFLLLACDHPSPVQANTAPSATVSAPASEDDRVLEAVVLHMLRDTRPDEIACLRVRPTKNELGDASVELLGRIRKVRPSTVNDSACEGGGPSGAVVVKETKAQAVMVDVGPVVWDGAVARVGGGLGRGGLHIRELEYELVRDGARWKVQSERVTAQN